MNRLQDISIFVSIVETRSLTRAAEREVLVDRGVVEGATAQDRVLRLEWCEDGQQSLGGGEVVTFELHLGRDGDYPFVAAQVGLDERVFGCEVLVQGARRYVSFLCERRDSGRVNPLLIEQPIRGSQDPFARAATADRPTWGAEWRQRDATFFTSDRFRKLVKDEGLSAIIVEQNPRQILPITHQAIVLDRGQIAHAAPSEQLLGDRETLDRWLAVARA
jgi:hypothetical protein